MNRVTMLLVLAPVFSCTCAAEAVDDYDSKCGYNGDMCDINPEDCLRKMRETGLRIRSCVGLSDGPGKLYNTRKDVTFWIHIDEKRRGEYPENLTYTIYNKRQRNWSIPNSLSKIKDCCGLTENDTCRLPKRKPGEIQFVFMPLQDQGDYDYCQYELQEKSERIKWCDDVDQMGCLEVRNGTLQFRSYTKPLNFVDGKWLVDYCFYAPPKTYPDREGASTFSDDTTTINITGNNIYARLQEGEMIQCEKHDNSFSRDVLKHPVLHRIKRETDFACFFVRIPNKNEKWLKNPGCVNMTAVSELTIEPVDTNSGLVAIIVIVIACSIVLAVVIGLMWLYKKHLKKCTFKRTMQELPDTLAMEKTHLDNNVNVEVTTKPKKEIVDEITFLETVRAVKMEEESTAMEKVDLLHDISRSENVETPKKATSIENQDAADSGFPTPPTDTELADQEHDESVTFPTTNSGQDDSGISSGFSKIEFNSSDAYTAKNSLTVEPQEADANQFRQTTLDIENEKQENAFAGKGLVETKTTVAFPSYVKKNFAMDNTNPGTVAPTLSTQSYTAKEEFA